MSLTSDFLKYSGVKATGQIGKEVAKESGKFAKEFVRQISGGWGDAFLSNFNTPKKKKKCKK